MTDLITWRRSVRRYTNENLDPALIDSLVTTAAHAPTGVNAQGVVFTVVLDNAFMDTPGRDCPAARGVFYSSSPAG